MKTLIPSRGAILFAAVMSCAAFLPAAEPRGGALTNLKLTGPVTITQSTRIEPGQYHVDVQDGQAVIEIAADNIILEMTGVTLESTARRPWERVGIGIHARGRSHVSVRGGAIRGYRINVFLEGEAGSGSGIKVVGTDVSGSRAQRLLSTDTHFEAQDWVNIFDLDAWETYGAGLYLKNIDGAWIKDVVAHEAQNGVMLARTTHATVEGCDLSRNSGWGISLYGSSGDDLLNNHADWDVRCEGRSYSAGCDSAGILLMEGSSHNRIIGNTFTYSGDGFFLSKSPTGAPSDGNYVAFNDGSASPHNSFEAVFTVGNQFYHNLANHSDYGFWLSFSRDSAVIDNHIEGSKRDGIAIEHGERNLFARNQIRSNGAAGIHLFQNAPVPDPSRNYVLLQNALEANRIGVLINRTEDVTITDNTFSNDQIGIKVEDGSRLVTVRGNHFSPGSAVTVESQDPKAVIADPEPPQGVMRSRPSR
jgi:parallel beta-helix repeat protein